MSSSRILGGREAGGAQPLAWRQAPPDPRPAAGNLYAGQDAASRESSREADRRELEEQARAAYQRGFREGEAAAAQTAGARLQPVLDRLGQTIQDLGGYRARLRREAEADLVRLAVEIARRILRRELSVDPEALLGVVKAGLERMAARESCRLRLHPGQVDVVRRYLAGGGHNIEVAADPGLEPGAAIFESEAGTIDAGIETQLSEIERGLADLAGGRGAGRR